MPKLNQIIAIEKGIKNTTQRDLTDAHHALQKTQLLTGISRTYKPRDDEGEQLPSEFTKVQLDAMDTLAATGKILTKLFDVTAAKEWANCKAKADVVVDGQTLLSDVPVTYLLFLEHQLQDVHTFVKKLPVQEPSETWHRDTNLGCWASEPTRTTRSKKVPRNWVKAEATDKHPAQVEVYHEDVLVGYWTTVKLTGALPAATIQDLVDRVVKLQQAVKFARENANAIEAPEVPAGKKIFDYLFPES
jgi:hypothetical protein